MPVSSGIWTLQKSDHGTANSCRKPHAISSQMFCRLKLSRTTIENAYLQLAADGYIVARAQSGYYVTNIAEQKPVSTTSWHANLPSIQYDFASNGVDHEVPFWPLAALYQKRTSSEWPSSLLWRTPGWSDLRQVLADTSVSEETSTVLLTILWSGPEFRAFWIFFVLWSMTEKPFLFQTLLLCREVLFFLIMVLKFNTATKTVT